MLPAPHRTGRREPRRVRRCVRCSPQTEIDLRLFGMLVALAAILIGFGIVTGGKILQPTQPGHAVDPDRDRRHHGDRHGPRHRVAQHRPVGRLARRRHRHELRAADDRLAAQHPRASAPTARYLDPRRGLRAGHRASAIGASRASSSPTSACRRSSSRWAGCSPSAGVVWQMSQGAAVSGLDPTFQLLSGSAQGSIGGTATWIVGAHRLPRGRRPARLQPAPATAVRLPGAAPVGRGRCSGLVGCGAILGLAAIANANYWPKGLATQYATENGITEPPGGLQISTGFPWPIMRRHRRHHRDDLHREPPALRALRLRLRRQPGRRRAGRHQHALDDHEDLHADGPAVRDRRGDRGGPAQRRHARCRPERRAVRHRGRRRRWHLVRGRHRDHPRRRPRCHRHAVAGLRTWLRRARTRRPRTSSPASCSSSRSASTRSTAGAARERAMEDDDR